MTVFASHFGPFGDRVWLNCAHQGPIPHVAAAAARRAIERKLAPFELRDESFTEVPRRLKQMLGRLIGAPPEEIILGNSASYGLHLLANGLPLQRGDEVLLVRGDFPSVVLPWLALEERGVRLRHIEPGEEGLTPETLEPHLGPRTIVLSTTWVHSFTGRAIDLDAIGRRCRSHGVWFIVNASQALGARPLDVTGAPVDAVISVGFKWLCGPYGTGFCWMTPRLLSSLRYNQAYWLAMQTAEELGGDSAIPVVKEDLGARRYDVFGTANFFNFEPLTASVDYLLTQGIDAVAAYDGALIDRLIEGLAELGYNVLSPREGDSRSTLVIASHGDRTRNEAIQRELQDRGIDVAYRRGNLRFSPHLYNTLEDVERALQALESCR
ncbi:MAG TPA: aminotransferase class V-fold PLP-dependent enzyme [Vicinamibacteria bacterium]|nr:aminotransferase class V-fold PLP-dependent enzyme [Vicinamibacteria bacterium]